MQKEDVIIITEDRALVAFKENTLEEILTAIEKDALNLVADIETATGRQQIKSKAASVASAKVLIDKVGKSLNDERKRQTDLVNGERRKAKDFLEDLKAKVRKPLTDWEEAEEIKKQAERDAVELEMLHEEALAEDDLFNRQKEIERKEAEFKALEDARIAKEQAEQEEKDRIKREAKIAKEAKEQAEKEAEEKIESEKRAKIAAEEKIKTDAKQADLDKKDALEKAERDQKEAVENAKLEEQERLAKIERIKAEDARVEKKKAEKKAANVAHQRKINREALDDFVKNGIPEEFGKKVISLVAKKEIRHIRIEY